jgi:hypothetical protein
MLTCGESKAKPKESVMPEKDWFPKSSERILAGKFYLMLLATVAVLVAAIVTTIAK